MRISDISDWAICEAKALANPRPQPARTNVAAWVGTLAHARLLRRFDHKIAEPSPPDVLHFDTGTGSWGEADFQASAVADKAAQILAEEGITVIEVEEAAASDDIEGHLDIRGWDGGARREVVIDLKTGYDVGAAWLQVGGYIWLATGLPGLPSFAAIAELKMDGGVLHVPRSKGYAELRGTLELRSGIGLVEAWVAFQARISDIQNGAVALHSPGIQCKRCHVRNCPVGIAE